MTHALLLTFFIKYGVPVAGIAVVLLLGLFSLFLNVLLPKLGKKKTPSNHHVNNH